MSYVRIWVHLVFATKNRTPWLKKPIKTLLIKHIIKNCKDKKIFLQAINGYHEHLHCLISMKNTQSIAEIAKLIKGESALWLNESRLLKETFNWQDDYFANSVSESQVENVVNYIKNQEQHHSSKSFSLEIEQLSKYLKFEITTLL